MAKTSTMAKYSVGVLLFAAAVFWSSASARPYNPKQQKVIDAVTEWALVEIKDVAEPHKTRLENILQHQHYDSLMEYMVYMKSMLVKFVQETGIDFSRRKRQVDSDSGESVEIDDNKIYIDLENKIYTHVLIAMAPLEYKSILEKKYYELLERGYSYDNDAKFQREAEDIFEKVTGLYIAKVRAELEANEESRLEFIKKYRGDLSDSFEEDFLLKHKFI